MAQHNSNKDFYFNQELFDEAKDLVFNENFSARKAVKHCNISAHRFRSYLKQFEPNYHAKRVEYVP
jgi:hypothetical protein